MLKVGMVAEEKPIVEDTPCVEVKRSWKGYGPWLVVLGWVHDGDDTRLQTRRSPMIVVPFLNTAVGKPIVDNIPSEMIVEDPFGMIVVDPFENMKRMKDERREAKLCTCRSCTSP